MESTDTYTVEVISNGQTTCEFEVDAQTHDGALAVLVTSQPEFEDPEGWAQYPHHVWMRTTAEHGNAVEWTGLMLSQWAAGEDVSLAAS